MGQKGQINSHHNVMFSKLLGDMGMVGHIGGKDCSDDGLTHSPP